MDSGGEVWLGEDMSVQLSVEEETPDGPVSFSGERLYQLRRQPEHHTNTTKLVKPWLYSFLDPYSTVNVQDTQVRHGVWMTTMYL